MLHRPTCLPFYLSDECRLTPYVGSRLPYHVAHTTVTEPLFSVLPLPITWSVEQSVAATIRWPCDGNHVTGITAICDKSIRARGALYILQIRILTYWDLKSRPVSTTPVIPACWRLIQYDVKISGARNRTCDLWIRKRVCYIYQLNHSAPHATWVYSMWSHAREQ